MGVLDPQNHAQWQDTNSGFKAEEAYSTELLTAAEEAGTVVDLISSQSGVRYGFLVPNGGVLDGRARVALVAVGGQRVDEADWLRMTLTCDEDGMTHVHAGWHD